MEKSLLNPLTLTCVSAIIAGLVPVAQAQESLQTIERAPENQFEKEHKESLAQYLGLGPISVRPHLYADTYYDSNLTLDRGHPDDDWVTRIFPGVLFGVGEFRGDKGTYVSLDYTLRGKIYSDHSDFNSADHYVIMGGGWKQAKLTLGLSQSYEIENGTSVEVGGFVEQESYVTQLTSRYDLSEKTYLELNGRQSLVSSDERVEHQPRFHLNSVNEWLVEGWGNYKATEKVTAGVGATFGWRDIRAYANGAAAAPDSPNQTFQQVLVRSSYEVSEKVHAMGSAGIQFSQFQDGSDKSPAFVFDLLGSWRPLENTYLTAEGYRRDVPSYAINGQNYTITGLRVSARQEFLVKYSATLAGGYENSDYTDASAATNQPDRTDNYFWVRPVVDYTVNDQINVGLFYQFRTKNSSDQAHDYHNHQIGLFGNYRF